MKMQIAEQRGIIDELTQVRLFFCDKMMLKYWIYESWFIPTIMTLSSSLFEINIFKLLLLNMYKNWIQLTLAIHLHYSHIHRNLNIFTHYNLVTFFFYLNYNRYIYLLT